MTDENMKSYRTHNTWWTLVNKFFTISHYQVWWSLSTF